MTKKQIIKLIMDERDHLRTRQRDSYDMANCISDSEDYYKGMAYAFNEAYRDLIDLIDEIALGERRFKL